MDSKFHNHNFSHTTNRWKDILKKAMFATVESKYNSLSSNGIYGDFHNFIIMLSSTCMQKFSWLGIYAR